jgi:hypothetical protein
LNKAESGVALSDPKGKNSGKKKRDRINFYSSTNNIRDSLKGLWQCVVEVTYFLFSPSPGMEMKPNLIE